MNDEQLKKLLQEEISKIPSSNFNYRILSAFLVKEKKKKPHFISFDEPVLIAMVIMGFVLLSAGLFYRSHLHISDDSVNVNIAIVVLLCAFIPIFIIAMNMVTKKLTQQGKASN